MKIDLLRLNLSNPA